MKNLLKIKIIVIVGLAVAFLFFIVAIFAAVTGTSLAVNEFNRQLSMFENEGEVTNNAIYSEKYKILLNKYLYSKGYVTLERLVYYLQRTNNLLDVSSLSLEEWDEAYLKNIDENEMQMIPIKWLCKDFKNNSSLQEYSITNGLSSEGVLIEKIDLCFVEKKNEEGVVIETIDITESLEYQDSFVTLPFIFPILSSERGEITSYVFAQRKVDIVSTDYSYHYGWDIAEAIGTNVYSVCNGEILKIVNSQGNDLNYSQQSEPKNAIGNYVEVICDNGLIVEYYHLKFNSVPFHLREGLKVRKGELLTKTSTSGLSEGPHLHLGLRNSAGKHLDIMRYIDFKINNYNYIDFR